MDQVKQAAESALLQSGFVYEQTSGMYYDYNTGYYYDTVCIDVLMNKTYTLRVLTTILAVGTCLGSNIINIGPLLE